MRSKSSIFEDSARLNALISGNIGCPLSLKCSIIRLALPVFECTFHTTYLLLQDRGMTNVLAENLFASSLASLEFARVGNDAKRVQSALCTRMRIVFSRIRLELKTSVCKEICHCHVFCIRL